MIPFYLLVAMVLVALAATLVALAGTDFRRDEVVMRAMPRLPFLPGPRRLVVLSSVDAATLVNESPDDTWLDELAEQLAPVAIMTGKSVSGISETELNSTYLIPALRGRPHIAVVWLGANAALMSDADLDSFITNSDAIISGLCDDANEVLIGLLPTPGRALQVPESGPISVTIGERVNRVNAELLRITSRTGAHTFTVDSANPGQFPLATVDGRGVIVLNADGELLAAAIVAGAVRDVINANRTLRLMTKTVAVNKAA